MRVRSIRPIISHAKLSTLLKPSLKFSPRCSCWVPDITVVYTVVNSGAETKLPELTAL